MTEHGVVGAGTPSALQLGNRPKPAAGRRPAECRRWCSRSQRASPRAAALHPAGAGCRMAARRVQRMLSSEPASLPTRRSPAPGRGRLPDGGPQSAEDGVVGASEPPRAPQPCNRQKPIAGLRPVECRGCCRRSQRASPRVATMQPAGAGCRSAGSGGVGAGEPPGAAALQPAGAGCRTAARSVQKMV